MLTAKKSLKQKDCIPGEVFYSICFASGFSPKNGAFLNYYRKSTKNPKVQVI
jgi:hypothetical protein